VGRNIGTSASQPYAVFGLEDARPWRNRRSIEGSRRGLDWSAGRVRRRHPAQFRSRAALGLPWLRSPVSVGGLMAASRSLRLPGTFLRSVTALVLVAGVLVRFHTLNGLSAGTALLCLMGGVKLLETRNSGINSL